MRFSIPILLTLLLFLSCEEALEYNPLDQDNNPDFVEPEAIITIDNLEGTTLDTSTVTITFMGNNGVVEYAYKLNDAQFPKTLQDIELDEEIKNAYMLVFSKTNEEAYVL